MKSKIRTGTLNGVSVFLFSLPIQLLFMLRMLFMLCMLFALRALFVLRT